ncbi:hypothetical protein N9D61_07470, partial [Planktomarina sp.]|nr:hypothetical protein [Planktomarina sp.]
NKKTGYAEVSISKSTLPRTNPQRTPSPNMQTPNVGQVAAKPLMRIFRVPAQKFDLVGLYPQICLYSELLLDLRPETIYDWI